MAVFALLLVMGPGGTQASSHREAPLISQDPLADNTDLYFFRTPNEDTVTIVANYIPLEEPNGGPNFNTFGDDVRYEIHIDNSGDGEEDITYRFRFKTKNMATNSFLFAGQRDDPFFVDLGPIFDLGRPPPLNTLHPTPPTPGARTDGVSPYNTHP